MASLQRLSQEQLELANYLERTKYFLKKEGSAFKKKMNETIFRLVRNLCIFLTCHIFVCRLNLPDAESSDTSAFWVASLSWIALWCFLTRSTYGVIGWEIKQMDRLLQGDELLKTNLAVLIRNIRDSFEIYRVTGEVIGGSAVGVDIKVSPHILDHKECVSQLALLKKLIEEPLVSSNYRFTYQMSVVTLSLIGILFAIGWTVIVGYAMRGDVHLEQQVSVL